jgi:NitT/TauT family transport system permease protein/taurine transport system permease protein
MMRKAPFDSGQRRVLGTLDAVVDHILWLPRPLLTVLSFVLFIVLWWLGTAIFPNSGLIPTPGEVGFRTVDMFKRHDLVDGISASMLRVLVGLVLGTVSGVIIGLLMGRSRLVSALIDPVFQLLRNLSPTAMIPVALVWFGIGESSKYFLIFWGTFFIVAVNTTAGTKSTPQTRIRAAQCLGASEVRIFFTVILPSALPYIITGVRLGVASAFMTIIPAELLAAQEGLGAMLQQASLNGQIDRMFVVLIIIATLGYGTDRLVQYLAENVLRRYTSYQSEQ